MTKSVHPEENEPRNANRHPSADPREIAELAPSEDLTLRVEQLFEEAEQLWQWMYGEGASS
jgi:hypothetical protein